jgi:hypothetical protein
MRRLLHVEVPPICFRVVSWIGQNGFVARFDRFRHPACGCGQFGQNRATARNRDRTKNNNENKDMVPRWIAHGDLTRGIPGGSSGAAVEFKFKRGVNAPETHPRTIRLIEAAQAIGGALAGLITFCIIARTISLGRGTP